MADVDATCICQFYISQIKLEIQFNLSYTVLQYWLLKGRSNEFDIKSICPYFETVAIVYLSVRQNPSFNYLFFS